MPPTAVPEFQEALVALTARSGDAAAQLLGRMDRLDRAEALAFVTDAYPDLMAPFLRASGDMTTQWYSEQPVGPAAAGSKLFVPEPADLPPVEQLAVNGRWAAVQNDPVGAIRGTATRAVMNQSRRTVVDNARRERKRWVRHAKPDACGFCRMLATRTGSTRAESTYTRGLSKNSDGDDILVVVGDRRGNPRGRRRIGDKYHDSCQCTAVVVRDGIYTPPSYVEKWKQDYRAAFNKYGSNPRAISAAMDDRPPAVRRPTKPADPVKTPDVDPTPVKLDTPAPAPAPARPKPKPKPKPKPAPEPEPAPAPAAVAVAEKPDRDPVFGFRLKDDPEFDPVADLAAINPNWLDGEEWQINCTRCAMAIEFRYRGYDVTAKPFFDGIDGENDAAGELARLLMPGTGKVAGTGRSQYATLFDRPTWPLEYDLGNNPDTVPGMGEVGGARYFHRLPAGAKKAKRTIDAAVKSWGPGSRGWVTVQWKGGDGGHIFNVVNRDGKVVYIDGQSNELDASDAFDRVSGRDGAVKIVRVDDLDLNPDKAGEWVRERTPEDIAKDADRMAASQARLEIKQRAAARAAETKKAEAARKRAAAATLKKGMPAETVNQGWAKYVNDTREWVGAEPSPALRADFEAGIALSQGVRPGTQVDLTKYTTDPDRLDAYRSGWFWHQRWKRSLTE